MKMEKLKQYKLSELYVMSSGISTKKEQAGHGAPFLSFRTVFNNCYIPNVLEDRMDTSEQEQNIFSVKKGDVFLTRTSETIDELGMSSVALKDYPNATYSGFLKRLRPLQSGITYDRYMAFYFRSAYFRKAMNNNASMTLRASLNEEIFSYITVALPDYETQVKIGDFLYSIEEKIRNNSLYVSELESMAKDIYDYWFVQFDFPDENGKPYKSSGGKMVWNEELKREIPEGWMKGCISSIATLINDQVSPEDNEIYIHYSIPAFDSGRIPVKEQGSTIESNKYVVSKEMILASKLNPQFPRIWWPAFIEANMICSTEFLPLIPNNELYRVFLYLLLKSDALCTEMKQKATCSTGSRRRIDPDVFMSICFALPTDKTIIAFSEKVFPIIEKVNVCLKENEELTSLRDFLLPLLMNGQVKIGDVEL